MGFKNLFKIKIKIDEETIIKGRGDIKKIKSLFEEFEKKVK